MDNWMKQKINIKNTVIISWHTESADFLQIEISPRHIFRIRIDRIKNK
jgi:hypothetical protein